jgi:hypothetical protein
MDVINLSALTSAELHQLDTALTLLDEALDGLLERDIIREGTGCDLEELSDAVAAEMEMREAVYE